MTSLTKIQKAIADRFMRMVIYRQVGGYIKKGIHPTAEQVMQDIDRKSLDTLIQQGYTIEEITGIAEEVIRRQKK